MARSRRWLLIAAVFVGAWLLSRWLTDAVIESHARPSLAKNSLQESPANRGRSSPSLPSTQTSSLSGAVRTAAGAPIAGALVCAAWAHDDLISGQKPSCTKTDADARYQLDDLRLGAYFVTASAAGFLSSAPPGASPLVLAAQSHRGVDIVLAPGGALLAGVVLDAAGGVVPNARVRAVRMLEPLTALEVESDAQGHFELSVPPGEIGLFAEADGYAQGSAGYIAPTSQAEVTLVPESSVSGTVISAEDGEPVANVEVRAMRADVPNVAVFRAGWSDSRGRFRITGLTLGAHQLSARGGRWHGELAEPVEVAVADAVKDLSIQVYREQELSGRVLDSEGKPCPQGAVILGPPDPELHGKELAQGSLDGVGPAQYARIEAEGRVHFQGVPRAFYYVTVDCAGHSLRAGPRSLFVQDAPLDELTWTVAAGVKLKVRVVDGGGEPMPYQSFDLLRFSQLGITEHTLSAGPSGEVVLPGLMPGEYELLPRGDADRGEKVRVNLREGSGPVEAVLRLRGSGEILIEAKGADGKPVEKLQVYARRKAAPGSAEPAPDVTALMPAGTAPLQPAPASIASVHAEALGQGKYRIGALLEGEYVITAEDEVALNPPLTARDTARVASGSVVRVELVFPRGGAIRGHVSDERGERIPNVWVAAARSSSEAANPSAVFSAIGANKRVLTDAEGEFLIEGLTADARYTVRASESYASAVVVRDVAAGAELALRLPSPATISGVVVDEQGAPVPTFAIEAKSADALSTRQVQVRSSDGRFVLRGVSPGRVELSASTPSGSAGMQHLQLASNQQWKDARIVLNRKAEASSVAINP